MRRPGRPAGLPARAIGLSGTESSAAACDLRWWYRYARLLEPADKASPLRHGSAWADWMRSLRAWWMVTDVSFPEGALDVSCLLCPVDAPDPACPYCLGDGLGPMGRVEKERRRLVRQGRADAAEVERDLTRLRRAAEGWLIVNGRAPYRTLKIVGVELGLAAPVVDPRTGSRFTGPSLVVDDGDGFVHLAGPGEADGARTVRWPWYIVGWLDAVARHRDTGELWVLEDKSSGHPRGYLDGIAVDGQLARYGWLLRHHALKLGGSGLGGWLYDVSNSHLQRDAVELKSGKLSRAKANTPTWRVRAQLDERGETNEPWLADLADRVDQKLYIRAWGRYDDAELDRVGAELLADARRAADRRRRAARVKTSGDASASFPRTPVCRLPGGRCAFLEVCARGPLAEPDERIEDRDPRRWRVGERPAPSLPLEERDG